MYWIVKHKAKMGQGGWRQAFREWVCSQRAGSAEAAVFAGVE